VSFGDSTPDLGPLPISDENAALQRESVKALNALLLGQDDVVFRDERIEDYGVDGSFELKLNGRMTNFRGQVQLKASAHAIPNADGTISLSVNTANLNYLLNGTAPLRGGAKVYRRSGGIVRLRRCESVPRERVSFSLYEHRPKGGKDVQRGDLSTHTACLSR
jgi:hypothetical protein